MRVLAPIWETVYISDVNRKEDPIRRAGSYEQELRPRADFFRDDWKDGALKSNFSKLPELSETS